MINKNEIIQILKNHSIEYWTDGNNVSEGSVNVQCPYCNDHSNHCGIFEDTLVFHCWRCEASGPFTRLLQKLTNLSSEECKRLVETSETDFKTPIEEKLQNLLRKPKIVEFENTLVKKIPWPEYSEPIDIDTKIPLLDAYLNRRNISIQTLVENRCRICQVGSYMNRLIIPVFYQNTLVSYQGADLTGRAEVKYRTAPGSINDYIYNIDNIDNSLILVEGILDAWRIGPIACATFGTSLTTRQKCLIEDLHLDNMIICWDGDAYWKARKVAKYFELTIPNITVVKLPIGEDPDSLGYEKLFSLIEEAEK